MIVRSLVSVGVRMHERHRAGAGNQPHHANLLPTITSPVSTRVKGYFVIECVAEQTEINKKSKRVAFVVFFSRCFFLVPFFPSETLWLLPTCIRLRKIADGIVQDDMSRIGGYA